MRKRIIPSSLPRIYRRLDRTFDKHIWWPAQSTFEVIVGAILAQHTAWRNVEVAIARLNAVRALTLPAMAHLPRRRLERLIRPAGCYRQKARYLHAVTAFLRRRYDGSLPRMWRTPQPALRRALLQVPGIGPETADSILLYAGRQPAFVVDAYTRRILSRHLLVASSVSYDALQRYGVQQLPARVPPVRTRAGRRVRPGARDRRAVVAVYQRCHALLVEVGKRYCRPVPRCAVCPLGDFSKRDGLNGPTPRSRRR